LCRARSSASKSQTEGDVSVDVRQTPWKTL
jgi:hypothetical protein